MLTWEDKDHVIVQLQLMAPIVFKDILEGREELDEVTEYALHEILADFDPDTALLCIAMCAEYVSQHMEDEELGKTLRLVAKNVVEDYGPLWLAHMAEDKDLDTMMLEVYLRDLEEDLAFLGNLLEATYNCLGDFNTPEAVLCDMLSLQCRYHQDMAENHVAKVLGETHKRIAKPRNNVIPFPLCADNDNAVKAKLFIYYLNCRLDVTLFSM